MIDLSRRIVFFDRLVIGAAVELFLSSLALGWATARVAVRDFVARSMQVIRHVRL